MELCQHIEEAGIHSGDSACSIPYRINYVMTVRGDKKTDCQNIPLGNLGYLVFVKIGNMPIFQDEDIPLLKGKIPKSHLEPSPLYPKATGVPTSKGGNKSYVTRRPKGGSRVL